MKEFKTFDEQLTILESRGLEISEEAKAFLETENYYNIINGYKSMFLDVNKTEIKGEDCYKDGAHFDELKNLFLLDRELRFIFLKYLLIFENSFKTVLSYTFSKNHLEENSYLAIANYKKDIPKRVLKQIAVLTGTIHDKVDKEGPIKHYIETHRSVPLWVLVNYLTIGNLAHLYSILKDTDRNEIARTYSIKYNKQHDNPEQLKLTDTDMETALKIINLVRNKCAHDERLYNTDLKNVRIKSLAKFYNLTNIDNRRLVVVIIYLKAFLDKHHYDSFQQELDSVLSKYKNSFTTIAFYDILKEIGFDYKDMEKLKI